MKKEKQPKNDVLKQAQEASAHSCDRLPRSHLGRRLVKLGVKEFGGACPVPLSLRFLLLLHLLDVTEKKKTLRPTTDFSVFRCEFWIQFWFGLLNNEPTTPADSRG